jgi:hypothetical protein
MLLTNWKQRLADGVKASGKSMRKISLDAKLGAGYVNSILNENKDPTIGNLARICEAANLSLYYVLVGADISPQDEDLLTLLLKADDQVKESVLTLLRNARRPATD